LFESSLSLRSFPEKED